MSDIIFGGSPSGTDDRMTFACGTMWSQAHDFVLDSPIRRRSGDVSGFRRALVHDQGDGLTLNFNNDYKGGVTINGPVTMTGDVTMNVNITTVSLAGGSKVSHESVKLGTLLGSLRNQVANLEARVAKLESK